MDLQNELKRPRNEGCRTGQRKISGPGSFHNQNMLTQSLKGNQRNWLSQEKFNGLDGFAFRSRVNNHLGKENCTSYKGI